jgi:hypothetical protein
MRRARSDLFDHHRGQPVPAVAVDELAPGAQVDQ